MLSTYPPAYRRPLPHARFSVTRALGRYGGPLRDSLHTAPRSPPRALSSPNTFTLRPYLHCFMSSPQSVVCSWPRIRSDLVTVMSRLLAGTKRALDASISHASCHLVLLGLPHVPQRSRSHPGLRMHDPGHCRHAPSRRLIRQRHSNPQSRRYRQRSTDKDSREGNSPW